MSAQQTTVMGVDITSPEKALWPRTADDPAPVTKLEYARYLQAIGPWMGPHLFNRPCAVVRAPEGVTGETFFQRHAPKGASQVIDAVDLDAGGEPYIEIRRVEALVALAQLSAIEFHPWNCRPSAPDVPGRLVFDLDPGPGMDFTAVVAAAHEVRERVAAAGLVGFCRTTGGKGLHVVVPLSPSKTLTWAHAKGFARNICQAMADGDPNRYVTQAAQAKRRDRIFLDYLRNDRSASAIALLSARARPGATVAMPLDWDEVRPDLDPGRYTVRTAPALLGASTVWRGYEAAERPLEAAIAKLG